MKEAIQLSSMLACEIEGKYIPLTYHFRQDKGKDKLHVSFGLEYEVAKPSGEYYLGVDLNENSLMYALVSNKTGNIYKEGNYTFPPDEKSVTRKQRLCNYVNEIIEVAKPFDASIVLENLDFEASKQVDSWICKVLHKMPYRTIKDIFLRKTLEKSVALLFVNPASTSVLGCLYLEKQRDIAAAAIIALKASIQGLKHIGKLIKSASQIRVNNKGQFGITVNLQRQRLKKPKDKKLSGGNGLFWNSYGFLSENNDIITTIRTRIKTIKDIYAYHRWKLKKPRDDALKVTLKSL